MTNIEKVRLGGEGYDEFKHNQAIITAFPSKFDQLRLKHNI